MSIYKLIDISLFTATNVCKWIVFYIALYFVCLIGTNLGFDTYYLYISIVVGVGLVYLVDIWFAIVLCDWFFVCRTIVIAIPLVFAQSVLSLLVSHSLHNIAVLWLSAIICWIVLNFVYRLHLSYLFVNNHSAFTVYRKRDYVRKNTVAYHTDYILSGTLSIYTNLKTLPLS